MSLVLTCNFDCIRSFWVENTQCLNKFFKLYMTIVIDVEKIKYLQSMAEHNFFRNESLNEIRALYHMELYPKQGSVNRNRCIS